ncbi:hypothetical protein Bca4012_065766 [Brassica carinata]
MDSYEHRPMDLEESTHECNAVKILTHEEFAAMHPHPPSLTKSIDRMDVASIDRRITKSIDILQNLSIDIQLSHAECNFPR